MSSPQEAAARFTARSDSNDPNHQDAVRLQQAPGAQTIEELYAVMLNMLRERPATLFVNSVSGDISGTFTALQQVIP